MNGLLLTDLHADSAWRFSRILPDGTPTRFADLLSVCAQVEQHMDWHPVDDLLIGGDVTNRRHFINFRLYNPLYRALERLTSRVRRTIIIVGNHDYETDTEHSLTPLRHLPNTTVIDRPMATTLSDGTPLMAIPYLHDAAAVSRAFESADAEHVVLSHYAAEGCPLETDYWLDSPVKLGELARFPLVLFGHVHRPSQQCPRCGERGEWTQERCQRCQVPYTVLYAGAPLHFDFGDVGSRGALLVQGDPAAPRVQRLLLQGPRFITASWPRLPMPPADGGYLRVLGAPAGKHDEVKEAAQKMGWLDAAVFTAAVPAEVRQAITSGLVVDRAMLEARVRARCPELTEDQVAQVVDVGEGLLLEARSR